MLFRKKKAAKQVTRSLSDLSNSLRAPVLTREQAKAADITAAQVAKDIPSTPSEVTPPKLPKTPLGAKPALPSQESSSASKSPEASELSVPGTQPFRANVERMNTWVRGGLERSWGPVRQTRSSFWILLASTALVVTTQVVLAYWTQIGMALNIVTLMVLITIALLRVDLRAIATSLAILPVVNMVSTSFVIQGTFERLTVLYGTLLVLTLTYRYLFTLDAPVVRSRLQLKGHALGIPLMLILGEVVGVLGYVFMKDYYPFKSVSLPVICTSMIIFAFAEEMFLRGLVQKQAEQLLKPWWAMAMTSLLYAALAFTSGTLLSIGPAVAMGVVLALVYRYKQNLLLSTTINAAAKLTYVGLVATFVLR